MAEKLLTTLELAERWGMSPATLDSMRSLDRKHPGKPRGPRYVQIGRSVRYRMVDILAYEDAHLSD